MRSVDSAGPWEQACWRALGGAIALAVMLAPRGGARIAADVRAAGWLGIASMLCIGGTFVVHVLAMNATSVANVLFLQTASPLLMPLLAWLVLGERPQALTVAAAAIAIAGLAPIVLASAGQGRIGGDLLALLSASFGAVNVLIVRKMRGVDLMPTTTAAALLAAVVAAVVGSATGVSGADAVALMALGALQIAVGLKLFFFALRHLPAAPVALLTLLEPVAGPLLVWGIVGEIPPDATLLGGAIIGGAMLLSMTSATRSARRTEGGS